MTYSSRTCSLGLDLHYTGPAKHIITARQGLMVCACGRVPMLGYPGTKASRVGHARVETRIHPGYIPGYTQSIYPGASSRVYTRVHPEYILGYIQSIYPGTSRVYTRVHPKYIPGYIQSIYPDTSRVYTRVHPEHIPGYIQSIYPGTSRVCPLHPWVFIRALYKVLERGRVLRRVALFSCLYH